MARLGEPDLSSDAHEKGLKGTRLQGQGLTLKRVLRVFGYEEWHVNLLYNRRLIGLAAL
jgi:hypothetical protein